MTSCICKLTAHHFIINSKHLDFFQSISSSTAYKNTLDFTSNLGLSKKSLERFLNHKAIFISCFLTTSVILNVYAWEYCMLARKVCETFILEMDVNLFQSFKPVRWVLRYVQGTQESFKFIFKFVQVFLECLVLAI